MASAYPKHLYPNVAFYENRVIAAPNDVFIDDILKKWYGNFDLLETNHSYIQWLFPNIDSGKNQQSFSLTPEEAKIIREREDLKKKVKRAFEMMLDFYGMKLVGNDQFKLTENADKNLAALNIEYNHNFQRITRILKALLELGHNNLMLPWLKFLADLIYKEKKLTCAHSSFEKYWVDTLDAEPKLELISYVKTLPKLKLTDTTTHGKPSDTSEDITTGTTTNTKAPTADSHNMSKVSKDASAGRTVTTFTSDTSSQSKSMKITEGNSLHTKNSKILAFYKNEIPFEPKGVCIDYILKFWREQPMKLTNDPHYIYWLFPSDLPGVISHLKLTDEEAKVIQETPELKGKVLEAFKMMLDFYGMSFNQRNEFTMINKTRMMKLNEINCHHHKHITRILRALKQLGHKELMLPWMRFMATFIFFNEILPNAKSSFKQYWIDILENKDQKDIRSLLTGRI